jgi:hypothetical protein
VRTARSGAEKTRGGEAAENKNVIPLLEYLEQSDIRLHASVGELEKANNALEAHLLGYNQ